MAGLQKLFFKKIFIKNLNLCNPKLNFFNGYSKKIVIMFKLILILCFSSYKFLSKHQKQSMILLEKLKKLNYFE